MSTQDAQPQHAADCNTPASSRSCPVSEGAHPRGVSRKSVQPSGQLASTAPASHPSTAAPSTSPHIPPSRHPVTRSAYCGAIDAAAGVDSAAVGGADMVGLGDVGAAVRGRLLVWAPAAWYRTQLVFSQACATAHPWCIEKDAVALQGGTGAGVVQASWCAAGGAGLPQVYRCCWQTSQRCSPCFQGIWEIT